jgi:cystathionine gamma-synthase
MQHALNVNNSYGIPDYGEHMWCEDAVVLEYNSRSYVERANRIGQTTSAIADYLGTHPKGEYSKCFDITNINTNVMLVAAVYYSEYTDRKYDVLKVANDNYGELISSILHTPEAV